MGKAALAPMEKPTQNSVIRGALAFRDWGAERMRFRNFANEELHHVASKARDIALVELAQLAQENADALTFTVQPSDLTAKFFCDSEQKRWAETLRNLWSDLAIWLVLAMTGGLLCYVAVLFLIEMEIALVAALVLTGILLFGAVLISALILKNLIQIGRRGYCETAVDTLHAHGRNVLTIGKKGIYIALNNSSEHPARTCVFYAFSSLQAPIWAEAMNQILIQLATASGTPIRTCIFSEADHAVATEAEEHLKEAITTFRHL